MKEGQNGFRKKIWKVLEMRMPSPPPGRHLWYRGKERCKSSRGRVWGISGRDGWGDLVPATDPALATDLDPDPAPTISHSSSPGEGLERLAAFLEATREV